VGADGGFRTPKLIYRKVSNKDGDLLNFTRMNIWKMDCPPVKAMAHLVPS
jgi:hypothetical protein